MFSDTNGYQVEVIHSFYMDDEQLTKWGIDKMTIWQYGNLKKLEVDKMSS
jgi:hypothetical protein